MILREDIYNDNEVSKNFINSYGYLISKLPKIEQTLFFLYFIRKVGQLELSKITGVSQGAISHRIRRIKNRLVYLKELEQIDFDKFYEDILEIADDYIDIEVLQGMVKTSCQSETAWRINSKYGLRGKKKFNQIKVRHRFEKLVEKLKKIKKYRYHYRTIRKIKDNLYILHEVKLPHFDKV